jgi:hypothetical protein
MAWLDNNVMVRRQPSLRVAEPAQIVSRKSIACSRWPLPTMIGSMSGANRTPSMLAPASRSWQLASPGSLMCRSSGKYRLKDVERRECEDDEDAHH